MAEGDALRRFAASMPMDHGKWHDGIGYDLDALREASAAEREEIERLVLAHAPRDGRDVEALAALGTPQALEALLAAARDGAPELRLALARHAPEVVTPDGRTEALVEALRSAELFGGLSQAIDDAADFHPPAVVRALEDGALARQGEAAVHFAALLAFVAGKASEPFDWELRPLFLRFHTEDLREREAAWRALSALTGNDPEPALRRRKVP